VSGAGRYFFASHERKQKKLIAIQNAAKINTSGWCALNELITATMASSHASSPPMRNALGGNSIGVLLDLAMRETLSRVD
jgi:hypothetical protein